MININYNYITKISSLIDSNKECISAQVFNTKNFEHLQNE